MKLKTLKDCYMSDGRNMEQRIKEEAIKWVKEILSHKRETKFTIQGRTHFSNEWVAIADFVIWQNNITEEDLK